MTQSLRDRALRALARREHTRAELAQKLSPHGSAEEISALLDQLQQSNLLSDARYAEGFVAARAARAGNAKLRYSLRAKGVAEELIESALLDSQKNEAGRARELWQRKFGTPPQDRNEYARQARFLQARGFPLDVIRRVLKDVGE
ncbi:MAG: recombination regulator RecX [Rhodocyclaceae bacterium]|nr:recombination regulator RecX [Rhodocyclaceae bacterium]